MDIGDLFRGIAVIVDDAIYIEGSSISNIKEVIEKKNIPVITYDKVPKNEIILSLRNVSFVILDWDFSSGSEKVEGEERIKLGDTLKESQEKYLINFIKNLLSNIFAPVFIFTDKEKDGIIDILRDNGLWNDDKPNRIFIMQKNELSTDDQLFNAIEKWLIDMPSVYVLKEWEHVITKAKNSMFIEMYDYSPNWVKIIWDMLKNDSHENHREFGDFVTRNLINRMGEYSFDESIINAEHGFSDIELSKVLEGERFVLVNDSSQSVHTGDLFLSEGSYLLNIRAQCDLSRERNPELYLIKGKELSDDDITTGNIEITNERELRINYDKRYSLEQIGDICGNDEQLKELNGLLKKHKSGAFFSSGDIIGKKSEIIITCIAGKKAIKFRLDLSVKKYGDVKKDRIGRILPPYITRIQQCCSQYIIREGIMPTPKELFNISEK